MAKKLIRFIHILLIISLIVSTVLYYNQYMVEAKATNASAIYELEKSFRTAFLNTISGRIAFDSSREGITEIYIMNPDGSNQVRLTGTDAANCRPIISPDGSKIVFYSFRNGPASEIYAMNIDGSDQIRLTNNSAYDNCPSWTPDGEKIIFVSNRDGSNNIYIMNKDGTNPVHLTNNTLPDEQPSSWSPDGTRIAYSSMQFVGSQGTDGYEIYTMNFDGSDKTRLTDNLKRDYEPAWSPDGTRIAFTSWRSDQTEVFVMDSDGSNQIKLANGASPTWSPDGTKIAFIQWNNNGANKIYIMNADGSNQTLVTDSAGLYWSPCWGVANGAPPSLGNSSVINVGINSVGLTGNLTSFGSAPDAYVTFQWGKAHNAYTNEARPVKKSSTGSFNFSVTGLDPATTYYFHSKTFRQGTSYSQESSFKTRNLDGSGGNQAFIALGSSLSPSAYGQTVTFTAMVNAVAPATGVPSGTITFQEGTTILGTGTINASGQATCNTSALSVGSHNISAIYLGDVNFAGILSGVLIKNIWKRGDAVGDGVVNMADVTKVERVILGLDSPTCACDTNNDNNINMGDVTKIERLILGLDPQ